MSTTTNKNMSTAKPFFDAFDSVVFGKQDSQNLKCFLKDYPEEELNARLAIYKNNTFYNLIDALKELYPAVERTIGAKLFTIASREYFLHSPPTSPAMNELGESFPLFLERFPATQSLAYLPDLARFELLYHQSYHSEDSKTAAMEDFAALDISTLASAKLKISPATRLFSSDYAIFDIWKLAINPDTTQNSVNAGIAQHILCLRPELQVDAYLIPEDLFFFLTLLLNGESIGTSIEIAQQHDDNFSPPEAIAFLIQSQITSSIVTNTTELSFKN